MDDQMIEAANLVAETLSKVDTANWPIVYVDVSTPKEVIKHFEDNGCNVVVEDFAKKEQDQKARQDFYTRLLAVANFNLDGSYNLKNPKFKTKKDRIDFFTSIENFDSIVNFIRDNWDSEYIGQNQKVKMRSMLEDMVCEIAHKQPSPVLDVYLGG